MPSLRSVMVYKCRLIPVFGLLALIALSQEVDKNKCETDHMEMLQMGTKITNQIVQDYEHGVHDSFEREDQEEIGQEDEQGILGFMEQEDEKDDEQGAFDFVEQEVELQADQEDEEGELDSMEDAEEDEEEAFDSVEQEDDQKVDEQDEDGTLGFLEQEDEHEDEQGVDDFMVQEVDQEDEQEDEQEGDEEDEEGAEQEDQHENEQAGFNLVEKEGEQETDEEDEQGPPVVQEDEQKEDQGAVDFVEQEDEHEDEQEDDQGDLDSVNQEDEQEEDEDESRRRRRRRRRRKKKSPKNCQSWCRNRVMAGVGTWKTECQKTKCSKCQQCSLPKNQLTDAEKEAQAKKRAEKKKKQKENAKKNKKNKKKKKKCKKSCKKLKAKKGVKPTWKDQCQKGKCAGCKQCSLPENQLTKEEKKAKEDAKKAKEKAQKCKPYCEKQVRRRRPWKKQCQRSKCSLCDPCSKKENQLTKEEQEEKAEKAKQQAGRGARRIYSWSKVPKSEWPPYPTANPTADRVIVPGSSVQVDKIHYARGETIRVEFVNPNTKKSRWAPVVGLFGASRLKPGKYLQIRFASLNVRTCVKDIGSKKCKDNPSKGTVEFSTAGFKAKIYGRSAYSRHPWPPGIGCYAVGLFTYAKGGGLMATSRTFSVGPPGMLTCTEPAWKKKSSEQHGGAELATIGRGDGFSVTAHRYAMNITPWSPSGGWRTDGDGGSLQITRMGNAWGLGPKTWAGNYGIPKYYFPVKRFDGHEGVIFQDKVDDEGNTGFGDILVTWLSLDYSSQTTSILYSNPQGSKVKRLCAVAYNDEKKQAILLFGLGWEQVGDGRAYMMKLAKLDLATNSIIKESKPINCGKTTGIVYPKWASSMAWSSKTGSISVIFNGGFLAGHQGARLAVFADADFSVIKRKITVSSHNAGHENGVLSDGSFFYTALSDVYPRGQKLAIYKKVQVPGTYVWQGNITKIQTRYRVPFTYMGSSKTKNDNNVYSTLARPGVEETNDGLLMFFTGAPPTLDKAPLDGPRQVGFVKVSKDLKNILSGDNVEEGVWQWSKKGKRKLKQQGVKWLTTFSGDENAFNLKSARLGPGRILLYWEVWAPDKYLRSQIMVIDDNGGVVNGPWGLTERMGSQWSDNMISTGNNRVAMMVGDCEWNCPVKGGYPQGCARSQCYIVHYEFCVGTSC